MKNELYQLTGVNYLKIHMLYVLYVFIHREKTLT
jgi:hypothetical protein